MLPSNVMRYRRAVGKFDQAVADKATNAGDEMHPCATGCTRVRPYL